jgi:hypothetical protein
LREEQIKLDKEKGDIKLRQANLDRRREDADARQQELEVRVVGTDLRNTIHLWDDLGLVVAPHFSQNNKVTVIVEGMDGAEDKREVIFNPKIINESPTSVQEHAQAQNSAQTKSVSSFPRQDIGDLDHPASRSPGIFSKTPSDLGENRIEPVTREYLDHALHASQRLR